ncbi:MAG: ShlB/FhaC/HecB family hemolysin secretion/activation protein [Proteobacteria bacterium]|nr:ShlB/FhaC/HecB family hemolysin secretion/activation protein [Pseudomonadota bacterium]
MRKLYSRYKTLIRLSPYFFFTFLIFETPSSLFGNVPPDLVNNKAFESVNAGRIANELSFPETSPINEAPPKPIIEKTPQSRIPNADKISFTLKNVRFIENNVFEEQELRDVFAPFFNKHITVAQAEDLIKQVTQKYHEEGYFLSTAIFPPQTIEDGTITIQIVEGSISHVNIQDFTDKQKDLLEKYAAQIMNKKPLKYEELERYLLLINDLVGFEVKSVISPDPENPGSSILTLVGTYSPLSASASFNNYGTRYIGPNRLTATTSFNSLLLPGGTLSLRYATAAHTKEIQFFEAIHDQALGTDGVHWSLGASHTDTRPQFTLSQYKIHGTNQNVFTSLSYPVIRSRQESLLSNLTFNYANVSSSASSVKFYEDRVRTAVLGGTYENYVGSGINVLNFNIHQGLNIMGAPKQGPTSRSGSRTNFRKFTFDISRNQFFDDMFSLFVMGNSQFTNSVLFTSEEFIFGGPSLGRGYDAAQLSGDRGLSGKAELRLTTKPQLDFLERVQYYTFLDGGAVWNVKKLSGNGRQSGTSTGLGIRSVLTPNFNFDVFVAKPLTRANATQQATHHNGKAALFYFQISTTW